MKKLKFFSRFVFFLMIIGLQSEAQTTYWTESFESANISSSNTYATPTTITTENGIWTFFQSYRSSSSTSFCSGTRGLRLINSSGAYAITPNLPNGAETLTYNNSRTSIRTLTFYATLKSDLTTVTDDDWVLVKTVTSTAAGCSAGLYTVSMQPSGLDLQLIRHIKIVNATTSDNDIDNVTIIAPIHVISSDTEILAFKMNGQVGNEVINYANGTIDINVAAGTNLLNVVPSSVSISSRAGISPLATAAKDFSGEQVVNYVVTAEDLTTKNWAVKVKSVLSAEKNILAFKLSNNQIGNASINTNLGKIVVTMPIGSNLSSLTPVNFSLSPNATVNPLINAAIDFSSQAIYTITAQDGSTKQWTVDVVLVDPNLTFTAYEAETADFTGKVDATHAGFTGTGFIDFLVDGDNKIIFTVCNQQAGVQTAKFRYSLAKDDSRIANLYVNDVLIQTVDFPRTVLFTDWAETVVSVNLQAGVNKIKLTWADTDGPNLDKLDLSGTQCTSYTLNLGTTNGGVVTLNPTRANNSYFSGEVVSLLAAQKPALAFDNWSGDLSGTTNPQTLIMNANKTVVGNFHVISTYKVNITTIGIGNVTLSPAGGEYPDGTVVTVTANTVLGSTFLGWSGHLNGTTASQQITVDGIKNITATFNDNLNLDFNKVIGFASITADGFVGPTTGGGAIIAGKTNDIVYINGPAEFGLFCEILQKRIKYKTYSSNPLTIVLEAGLYTGAGGKESVWANSMLTVQEQSNLTIIGRKNVVFNFGLNIKRSSNLIIRNISFQDYYDDGINIGETETHHIWVDHCTVGHPTTKPIDSEHPDGGIDVKNGASYVTISWTLYRNSWKTGLVGHSDNNGAIDNGRLKVTYYSNYFYGTNSRNPRVRFGEVHVLNNLEENVNLYGIAAANGAPVFAENNFFLNSRWPMYADRTSADFKLIYGNNSDDTFTSKTGNYPAKGLKQVGNAYDDSGLSVITSQITPNMLNPGGRSVKFDEFNPQDVFDPATYYTYDALPATVVKVLVPIYAGADKVDWFPQTLPLNLLAFDAKLLGTSSNKQVKVNWTTTNEVNTSRFEVLRRGDHTSFSIANTQASKNTAGIHQYSFIDSAPLNGNSYYQLKQIDVDGKFMLSEIKPISNQLLEKPAVVYPNPTDGLVYLEYPVLERAGTVYVYDTQGQKRLKVILPAGQNNNTIDLTNFPSGFYVLNMEYNGLKKSLKVIKN